MTQRKTISLVIPAYREEKNIALIYSEIKTKLFILDKYDFEVFFIDDGSTDNTWKEIVQLADRNNSIIGIHLSRNFGHQAALSAGLEHATGDAIITLDCDMQDPISAVVAMIHTWEKGSQIVLGKRIQRKEGYLKVLSADLYYNLLSYVSEYKVNDCAGDFRLIDASLHHQYLSVVQKGHYIRGVFDWFGHCPSYVEYERNSRKFGESNYTIRKMLQLALDGMLRFSLFPIRIGAVLGICICMASFMVMMYNLIFTLSFEESFKPLLFGLLGINLIFIWIIAEFVGKIYTMQCGLPLYVIDNTYRGK